MPCYLIPSRWSLGQRPPLLPELALLVRRGMRPAIGAVGWPSSGSMGLMGQPRHPDVLRAIETVIDKTRQAGLFVGIGIGDDPDLVMEWADKGAQWLAMGSDVGLMLRAARQRIVDGVAQSKGALGVMVGNAQAARQHRVVSAATFEFVLPGLSVSV